MAILENEGINLYYLIRFGELNLALGQEILFMITGVGFGVLFVRGWLALNVFRLILVCFNLKAFFVSLVYFLMDYSLFFFFICYFFYFVNFFIFINKNYYY